LPVVLGIAVAVALVAGVLFIVRDDDSADVEQVTLEPIGYSQEDDFFGNLDVGLVPDAAEQTISEISASLDELPELGDLAGDAGTSLSGVAATGDDPGLYGGSREDGVCDVEALAGYLTDPANADKATAWAGVLGISTDDIADYLERLTPVRLRMDTRVTNHGFESGEATPFQSVLEAGTAVLVDDTGQPVVKCNCGNPLGPPEDVGDVSADEALDVDAVAANPDAAWDTFDPSKTVTVEAASEPADAIIVVDLESGGLLERPVGSSGEDDRGTGEFQATLEWETTADLDLSVTDPGGIEIWYSDPTPSGTEGELDRDANVGCPELTEAPVENVFWSEGDAPPGEYTVEVVGFSVGDGCGDGSYTLTISVFGREDEVHTGTVGPRETASYTVTLE
jgi:hypothetical protein